MTTRAAEQFAKVVIAMEPYVNEIVFVGGWVHALYLAEANESGAVGTEDIDITLPRELLSDDRPTLLKLAADAGFERDPISEMEGVPQWLVYTNEDGDTIPIDFLTEGEPRIPVEIEGQRGLLAQGYPGQRVLLENTRAMTVGTNVHALLEPSRSIRVPTLGAYVLQKGISASTRTNRQKQAKDLVYIYEIVRHPRLGVSVFGELRALRPSYPDEHARWRDEIEAALRTPVIMAEIAEQLSLYGRSFGSDAAIQSSVSAWFRRLIAEGS
jgi:hypothetical protein